MKTEHTPGPWEASNFEGQTWITSPNMQTTICEVVEPFGLPTWEATKREQEANARLIAASPTMYDFVKKCAAEGNRDATRILEVIHA